MDHNTERRKKWKGFFGKAFSENKSEPLEKIKGIMIYYDENGSELTRISLLKLPLKEEYIKRKSLELYKEEEPCVIYRTSIINKIGLELLLKLNEDIKGEVMTKKEIDELVEGILELPEEVKTIKFV